MNRRNLALLAALALPLALAAAADAVPAWQAKLDAFEKTGEAERKKLGLDRNRDALRQRYPTPEVTFGEPRVLCPGAVADVKLDGKIQEGSLVVARTDAAEVASGARTKDGGWAGKVRAVPGAAPGPVNLVVVAPVSLIEGYATPVFVGCRYTFTLDAGGDALVVHADLSGDDARGEGEWRRAGKVLGKVPYRLSISEGSVSLQQDQSPEEMQAQVGGFTGMMESKAWKDLDARTNVEMKKIEACAKLPPEKMAACFAAPQKALEKLNEERQKLVAGAEVAGAPAFGCRQLALTLRGGKVEGDAEQCAGKRTNDRVAVKGTYASP
ncbi:MAG: hypothetical protein QM704_11330 [Anaeromyxobacteraceae bacterium]